MQAWAGISRKCREGLKRASPLLVDALEQRILAALAAAAVEAADAGGSVDSAGATEVSMHLGDGFQRLLAHGVAQFHGLSSHSRAALAGEFGAADCTVSQSEAPEEAAACDRIFVVRRPSPSVSFTHQQDAMSVLDSGPDGGRHMMLWLHLGPGDSNKNSVHSWSPSNGYLNRSKLASTRLRNNHIIYPSVILPLPRDMQGTEVCNPLPHP